MSVCALREDGKKEIKISRFSINIKASNTSVLENKGKTFKELNIQNQKL